MKHPINKKLNLLRRLQVNRNFNPLRNTYRNGNNPFNSYYLNTNGLHKYEHLFGGPLVIAGVVRNGNRLHIKGLTSLNSLKRKYLHRSYKPGGTGYKRVAARYSRKRNN